MLLVLPPIYYKNPIETMDANVDGFHNLLEFIKNRNNNGEFVGGLLTSQLVKYMGSRSKNIPTSEDYRGNVSCTGPRACYDNQSAMVRFLSTLVQQYDLPIKIVRPFNNYGLGLKITDGRALLIL